MEESKTCVSCGAEVTGRFCVRCGEQQLDPELRALSHLARDFIEGLTSVDGKLMRTLQYLFLKPGQLDFDYHFGKRNPYIKPITLFLLINVFFVSFASITDFYLIFSDQLNAQLYSPFVRENIGHIFPLYVADAESFRQNYDQLVKVVARSIIIVQVPIYALLTFWLFLGRGRFASDHLVFAFNVHSFLLAWIVLTRLPAIAISWSAALVGIQTSDWFWYFNLLLLGMLVYLFVATRRAYQLTWLETSWRFPVLIVALALAHGAFRFAQFLITGALVEV